MGNFLTILALLVAFIPVSSVLAEDQTTNPDTTTTTEVKTETQDTADKVYDLENVDSAEFKAKLEARLKARKETMAAKIAAYQQKRIQSRCKASQSLINKVSEKASAAKTSRDEIYNNMTKNALKLSDRMKENGQDTALLDKNIEELNMLIDKFKTDLKEMRQAAQDLTVMDCVADPSGFTSSLEVLRQAREDVTKDSQAIRDYIKNNLKPTLQDIRNNIGQVKQEGAN
jgi:hypothetical protein